MMSKNKHLYFAILLLTFVVFFSCSTKKNTFTRRFYHNLTSKYNAYFNGNESLKEGVRQIENQQKDNYTQVLPIFLYGDEKIAVASAPAMDKAIKKASIVIKRHSMFFHKTEYCRWVDDSYLLMGKAQFYKQDYLLASQTFRYIISHFSRNEIKYDAMLWLARIYNIEKDYDKSYTILDNIQNNIEKGKVSKTVKKNFSLVYADLYIRQENYPPAIEYLITAIDVNKKKKTKVRLNFILAQIYQRSGRCPDASIRYRKVIKMGPPYEMAFHSKINIARCFDAESDNSRDIKKILLKMVKDEKNKEYLDEIYYALAEISLKEKDKAKAIEYLQLSVLTSVNNNNQKTISALTLADIYFSESDYLNAQAYYDSTMIFLPKDYPDYKKIERKKNTLTELVKNLIVIQTEDSLQALANMSASERNAIIDEIIEEIIEEEQRKQQEEIDRQMSLQFLDQENREQKTNQASGSQWYFYNSSALSFGFSEFEKKWGNRKLEDLWRLSNKQSVSFDFGDEGEEGDKDTRSDSAKQASANLKDRNFYLQDVPLTAEAMKASDKKIIEALYNSGVIYKEGLQDFDKSIETFETLLKDYPNNDYILKSYYQLYRIYKELEFEDDALKYKNLIISKFSESDYAKILADPNYYKKLQAEKNKAAIFYKETFLAYSNKEYQTVISNNTKAIELYNDTMLLSKFEYLSAISIGKTQDTAAFVVALKSVIKNHPKAAVTPLAQNILDQLTKPVMQLSEIKKGKVKGQEKEISEDGSPYSFDENAIHLFVSVVEIKKVSMNDYKIAISDYNQKYYSMEKLTISTVFLDPTHQMLSVSNFKDKHKAMSYFNSIDSSKDLKSYFRKNNAENVVISVSNYSVFYKNKDLGIYLDFFKKYYLD